MRNYRIKQVSEKNFMSALTHSRQLSKMLQKRVRCDKDYIDDVKVAATSF